MIGWAIDIHPPADPNPMIYNAVDQLTSWPGMYGYQYDLRGNLTQVSNAAGTQIAAYSSGPTGLLDSARFVDSTGNNASLTNAWDADSKRVGMNANGQAYSFAYDITVGIPAVVVESSGSGVVYYIREPNGALIARVQGSIPWYYHFDALGSTRMITDSAGNVTDEYDYDAYGACLWHECNAGSIGQPYQYVGQLGYYTRLSGA